MKKHLPAILLTCLFIPTLVLGKEAAKQINSTGFIENKGQVSDQHHAPRPDILFTGTTGNLNYYLSTKGISYQLCSVARWKEEKDNLLLKTNKVADQLNIYRLDMEWLGINKNFKIRTDASLPGYTNYHLAVCPNGIYNVKTFTGVTYENLYKNIDLHYYQRNGHLKYDYLVAPYGDYTQLRIRINGATKITLQRDGSLAIETPLGTIVEEAPLVLQNEKPILSHWTLAGNELGFSIGAYDAALPLIIDPLVRTWSTYYGNTGIDEGKGCVTDVNGNVYMTGRTNSGSTIATTGSFQNTISGTYDAFLAKFNNAGVRLWATYYGGSGDEYGNACISDAAGNIYMAGQTTGSSSGIASPGTGHQGFNPGGWDAFLVKFNASGVRQWGTYYGGSSNDQGEALAINGNDLYMSGYTNSIAGGIPANPIATPGAHQTAFGSAFLVKFNTGGVRQWGTYYSNSQYTHANCCTTDASGNVFMAGNTESTTNIATTGAHQTSFLGLMDGYLVKFNSAGVRQWGTYYGDISYETVAAVVADASGNVYIGGSSGSPVGIATAGAHQTVIGTQYNPDGMLVKFNGAGVRQWGTYYGGLTEDYINACTIAPNGNIYIAGYSNSSVGIATANGFQTNYAGLGDGFVASFTQGGTRVWGTYYGETGDDFIYGCASDANNTIYITGRSSSQAGNVFASSGSHQGVYGGGTFDSFLAQFTDCVLPAAPVNVTPVANATVCSGSTLTLSATANGTINWYGSATTIINLGTGTTFTAVPPGVGSFTYFAEVTDNCGTNTVRTPVAIHIFAAPVINISGTSSVCLGSAVTLIASGASMYSWNTGANSASITVTPNSTTAYTVNGTLFNGCAATAIYTVTAYPQPTLNATASNTLICKGKTVTLTATGANQYSWNTGANGSVLTITPTATTNYTVTGNLDGCIGTANIALVVSPCAGIEQVEDDLYVNVFPNPVKDVLHIQASAPVELKIITSIGQVILQKKSENKLLMLDVSTYAQGVYFLEIKQDKQVKVIRILKE